MRHQYLQSPQNQQRPPYRCASDIGAWQDVINLIALMAVITNAGLRGLTGHVVYFYSPSLSFVDRLWFVAVLEHVMLIIKILLENTDKVEELDIRLRQGMTIFRVERRRPDVASRKTNRARVAVR